MIIVISGYNVLIDEDDYEKINKHHWHCNSNKKNRASGYIYFCTKIDKKVIFLHRYIIGLWKEDKMFCDHKNGNTLDNRKSNLRPATKTQNAQNIKMKCYKKSGRLKGTAPWGNKWRADIKYYGNRKYLGLYNTEKEAHEAYCHAAMVFHGEFHRP